MTDGIRCRKLSPENVPLFLSYFGVRDRLRREQGVWRNSLCRRQRAEKILQSAGRAVADADWEAAELSQRPSSISLLHFCPPAYLPLLLSPRPAPPPAVSLTESDHPARRREAEQMADRAAARQSQRGIKWERRQKMSPRL